MVADVQTTEGLAEAVDLDSDIDAEVSPEVDDDPVAALRAELAATNAKIAALEGLRVLNPEQINRALGHIPRLQSDLDGLKKGSSDPVAAIDPRLSESEDVLSELVDALVASEFLDDSAKAALRQRRQRMDVGRTERERVKLRRDLLSEVQGARETVQDAQITPDAQAVLEVQNETVRLMGYAEAKGIEWNSIPADELQFRPGETLKQAAVRVQKTINDLAGESAATERTATRRRAAGQGAPASNGNNGYRTQSAIDVAHMNGQLTTAQVMELRSSGRYAALPYS